MVLTYDIKLHPYWLVWNDEISWFINKNLFGSGCCWALVDWPTMANTVLEGSYQIYIFHCNNHMVLMYHIILNPYWLFWNDGMSRFIHKDFFGDLLLRSAEWIDPTCPTLHGMVHTSVTYSIVTNTCCCCITSNCIHIDWYGMIHKDCFGDLLLRSAEWIDPTCPTLYGKVHIRFTYSIVTDTCCWCITS